MDFLEKPVISTRVLSSKGYKKLENVQITYFCRESLFGNYLGAFLDDELCYLGFYDSDSESCLRQLEKLYKNAVFTYKDDVESPNQLRAVLKGTDFEVAVWTELLKIKRGSTVSYDTIAEALGKPKSGRAVGNAVGKNHIAYIVPCHRVIRKNGEIGGFSCGPHRKLRMLRYEGAKFKC